MRILITFEVSGDSLWPLMSIIYIMLFYWRTMSMCYLQMSAYEKSHLCRYIIWEAMYRRAAEIDEIEDNAAEVEQLLSIVKQCENIEGG